MDQALEKFREGTVGYFAPLTPPPGADDWEKGHLQLREDGEAHVVTLDERATRRLGEHPPTASSLVGITEHGGVLLLDLPGRGATTSLGGVRASVYRYRAGTMVMGIDPASIVSPRLRRAEVFFYGLGSWAGISGSTTNRTVDDAGRLQSWSATLSSAQAVDAETSKSRVLQLSATWRVDGPEDRRVLHTPLKLGVWTRRPRDVRSILGPIAHIQELASFAFGGFVAARGGRAVPHASSDDPGDLWDRRLMRVPDFVKEPKSQTEFPLFSLTGLGGLPALSRWVRLSEEHWRAVGPVVARFRVGSGAAETRLLDACAGIEYWVAFHRRQRVAWARERLWPLAIARRVSSAFANWVGDTRVWADAVWTTYNELKHQPGAQLDPWRTHLLAESARLLLGATLVDRAAGSRKASEQIFRSHRVYNLGADVRGELGT
ncbi:ApeA N-terminal domain 1-containing protein [Kribbella sp. NPDC055110]